MRVRLLGPVSAETDSAPLRLGGRKQRAVFALLALQVNGPVALDRLVHELWRDEPPAQATLSLQSYISRLRRTIAEAHPEGEPAPHIVTRPPGWALEMPAHEVDAVAFAEGARDGTTLIEEGNVAAGAETLRAALGLWSGEALADLDDMPFAAEEKARLDELRMSVAEALLGADLELGRPADVVASARQMISQNPYRERAWCALMLALYRLGRQAEALEVAQQLRETLGEGLGLDPSPDARLLQERILRQDAVLDHVGDPSLSRTERVRPTAPTTAPAPATDSPLVGRASELRSLADVSQATAAGSGQFVVVEGQAGMGKSALLDDLSRRAGEDGALVLRSGGVAEGAMPALWPWVSILRQLVEAVPEAMQAAKGEVSVALALLDPSVGVGAEVSHGPGDPVLSRTRLYRAVVDLLGTAHRIRPLALLIDDTHWLDVDTLGLLALVADELLPEGVILAVALRDEESPDVTARIDDLSSRHRGHSTRLRLTGLEADAVAEIVRRQGGSAPPTVVDALVARTGGNPLFVSEVVRLLVSERRLDEESVSRALPDEVREVLRRRLDRLPDETRVLLTAVALINRAVDVETLAEVTGLSEDAALAGAEAALASRLLVEDTASTGFVLSHDLVRQTLEEELSTTRKSRVHAHIASVLQGQEGSTGTVLPERVVEIARHLLLAESVVGPSAAIPYLLAVADDAHRRSAFDLSERALRIALEASQRIVEPDQQARVELQVRTRLALESMIVPATESLAPAEASDARGPTVPPIEVDPMAWWGYQTMLVLAGKPREARAVLEAVLGDDLSDEARTVVEQAAGTTYFDLGSLELAQDHLARAEDRVNEWALTSPDELSPWARGARVSIPTLRAAVAALREDVERFEAYLEVARSRAGTSAPHRGLVEYFAAWAAAQRGDPETAMAHARQGLELGEQLGDSIYVPMSRNILGWSMAVLGDQLGAAMAVDGHEACVRGGNHYQSTVRLLLCAEAHAHHANDQAARDLVLRARDKADTFGERTLGPRLEGVGRRLVGETG